MSGTDVDPRVEEEGPSYAGAIALNYRLIKKLGEGGFGAVYLAEHVDLKRKVACKILHPQFARDPGQVERFFREARAVCDIGHPTIAAIENFGRLDAGEPFYLMEYFPGLPLGRLAAERRLDAGQLVTIFDAIVDALTAAHAKGIIHRDLKPDNIMVAMDGDRVSAVRLLDFGIAKLLDAVDGVASLSGFPMGTPAYMAPEQALDSKNVDLRADVYSFAATVFATIAGRPPFVAPSVAALLVSVQTTPAASLRSLVPTAPEVLDRAIARCLEKSPDARPATVAAAWAEIRAALLFRTDPSALVAQSVAAPAPAAPDAATMLAASPRMWRADQVGSAAAPLPTALRSVPPTALAPTRSRTPVFLVIGGVCVAAVLVVIVVAMAGGKPRGPAAAVTITDAATAAVPVSATVSDAATASDPGPDAATVSNPVSDPAADASTPVTDRIDAGVRRRPPPPPRLDCSEGSFAAISRAAAPDDAAVRSALRRLKQCEPQLDVGTYRRIQAALIAKQ